jgi:ABC-type antimicrobial peptide transport system permease subunit
VNETVVYTQKETLDRILGKKMVHEVSIILHDIDQVAQTEIQLRQQLSENYKVEAYLDYAPELDLLDQQSRVSKQLLTTIIMLALLFGIINTMLMAVLERTKELGMLRAIGMKKQRVFIMILLETLMLSFLGGPIGILLGLVLVQYFQYKGLDLTRYADTLSEFGYDAVFYPEISTSYYFILMLVVIITALIGAIFPALRAMKLNPVEAIRKI